MSISPVAIICVSHNMTAAARQRTRTVQKSSKGSMRERKPRLLNFKKSQAASAARVRALYNLTAAAHQQARIVSNDRYSLCHCARQDPHHAYCGELRLAQETLARASQAASLAELSASIAHEANQPLAAVVANSHTCQRWLKYDPPNPERA